MSESVPVLKDEENQKPIPSLWRSTLSDVAKAFMEGDFVLGRGVAGVRPVSLDTATRIERNIKGYGARLIELPEDTWETSACQWMLSYWDVLVDLFTAEEGASDLALAVRVYEEDGNYAFEIKSVYVP